MQFDCPACGAVLTVPAAIAGMQGPCPKCWQEIISPDPARGLPARRPAPPPVAVTPAPDLETAPAPVPAEPPRADAIPIADDCDAAVPAPRPRSKAKFVLAIGVPALAFAAVGYHFGKGRRPPIIESPVLELPAEPPAAAPAEPAPAPTPDETGQGSQPPPAPVSSEAADAQEALIAFLGAPDWQARSAFVLSPEEIRPEMEKHARLNGDGPIPASAIQLLEISPPNSIFKVCTKAMPDGFPVPVTLTDDGPKIDWEAFTAFNDDHFRKLLVGPPDQNGIFNLLVKPETGDEPSPHYSRYRLSVPMPGREATSWVRKDSVALARLKAVFEGAGGYDKDTVDKLVSETGVPLRLAVTKRTTNDGREYLEVVDLVAVGWAPAKP